MGEGTPFRFAVSTAATRPHGEWIETAQKAEDLGFSTLLVADHFANLFAPLLALMSAADATTTLRVGTLVLANDYRHPVMLAKEAATLDVLSDGRFELGIGAGWKRDEYEQAGIRFDDASIRVDRLEESIQVIKGLFAGDPVNFEGQHYHVRDMVGYPRPIQQPHPPLMIGGARKRMLSLAAREANIIALATKVYADGRHDFVDSTGPAIARKVQWIREAAGPRYGELELHIHVGGVIVTPGREEVAESMAPTVGLSGEQLLDCVQALIGTEDQIVADLLQRREQYGISYVSIEERDMDGAAPIITRLAGT